MFDAYHKMLAHFHWTWLENKFCRFHKKPRSKERVATGLARAKARQAVKKEIEEEVER